MNIPLTANLGSSPKTVLENSVIKHKETSKDGKLFQALFSNMNTRKAEDTPSKLSVNEESRNLSQLLENLETSVESLMERETIPNEKIEQVNEWLDELNVKFPGRIPLMDELTSADVQSETFSKLVDTNGLDSEFDEIRKLVKEISQKNPGSEQITSYSFNPSPALEIIKGPEIESRASDTLEQKLHNLWQQFQSITKTISNQSEWKSFDVKKGQEMKEVMQKLIGITSTLSPQEKGEWKALIQKVTQEGTSQEKQLFQRLMTTFQNRSELPKTYDLQMPVTGKEIAKWVKKIGDDGSNREPKIQLSNQSILQQSGPLPTARVEQHIIQMNQPQNATSLQKQLHQRIEQLIQSSQMFTNKNGHAEMQIKLRPGNLGDLTIKFAQVNGELAVKILATSQSAKDMLEGNMKQLRHMFSPQQVVVEKVEASSMQQQIQEQLDGGPTKDNEEENRKREIPPERAEDQDEEELSFREILMNEKV